jgi:hypothetical protein
MVCFDEDITGQRPSSRLYILGSSPGYNGFCNSVRKQGRRTEPKAKLFRRGFYGRKGYKPKTVLGSSPGKDVEIKNNFFL